MRPHHSAGHTSCVISCLSLSTWDHSVVEPCLANLAWALPAGGCGGGGGASRKSLSPEISQGSNVPFQELLLTDPGLPQQPGVSGMIPQLGDLGGECGEGRLVPWPWDPPPEKQQASGRAPCGERGFSVGG